MNYILTGGSGFIGRHFSEILKDKITYNFDINTSKIPNNQKNINILDISSLMKYRPPSDKTHTLIHLAAVHFDFQKNFYETNVNGTKNILKYAEKYKVKNFVFFSSVAIYCNSTSNGMDENSLKNPVNAYGESKLQAENLVKIWANKNNNCRVIIVRPAVVYGEYNFGNVFNLIKQIKSGLYAVIGSGNNIKSITYVKNLVDSVFFCINNNKIKYLEYNYSDYPQLNVIDLSRLISKKIGLKILLRIPLLFTKFFTKPIDFFQMRIKKDLIFNSKRIKKFTDYSYFKSDKIRSLGFKPRYSIDNGFERTLKWVNGNNIKALRKEWFKI